MEAGEAIRAIVTACATGGPSTGGDLTLVIVILTSSMGAGGRGKSRLKYNAGGIYAMFLIKGY